MKFFCIKLIVLSIVFFSGCSTKKNTLLTRSYHNVTARYNIYFNGNESFKTGIQSLEKSYKDNYTEILPLFIDKNKNYLNPLKGDMEKSIKKSSKLIKMHSLKAKPKRPANREMTAKEREFYRKNEYCRWIDDSYLLIGKANFYSEDYPKAINSFQQIITHYPEESAFVDAQIWLLRTFIENERWPEAKEQLNIIKNNKKLPEKRKLDLLLVECDYYLTQKQYDNAIPLLEKALKLKPQKKLRSRINFILAQLHESKGNKSKSIDYYKEVIDLDQSYEMAFYAQINMAMLSDGNKNSGKLEEDLLKLLKNAKNADFHAQLHFALAKLNMGNKDTSEAIKYYKLSVQSENAENTQKALSFLALGDIFFEKQEYIAAGLYYDSTLNFLDQKFSRYPEISKQTISLKALIENLNIIQKQDSLQKLADLPPKERLEIINTIINEIRKNEALEKQKQQELAGNSGSLNEAAFNPMTSNANKWYFYNPTTVSYGSTEFKKRWGTRKLEDHWRRADKKNQVGEFALTATNEEQEVNGKSEEKLDNKMPEYYLQSIPLSDSARQVSDKAIAEALFNAGNIYKAQLDEPQMAVDLLEEFMRRFPSNELAVQTAYNLYLINNQRDKQEEAKKWKNYLLKNFPESNYAKILENPDYIDQLKHQAKEAEILYEQCYNAYQEGHFTKVTEISKQAVLKYPTHELIPKFLLLNAYSTARSGQIDLYITQLEKIKKTYPGTYESGKADEILKLIFNSQQAGLNQIEDAQLRKAAGLFSLKFDTTHWSIYYSRNPQLDLNRFRFDIFNLTLENFANDNLEVDLASLEKTNLILIKSFSNKNSVLSFNGQADNILIQMKKYNEKDFGHYIISAENFGKIKSEADLFLYQIFYKKYYISK